MPELPEVETIRMQLDRSLKDLKIAEIEILNPKSFQGEAEKVKGKKVVLVRRRAKIVIIELEGEVCLAIHLKLTGQLIYQKAKTQACTTAEIVKEQKTEGPFAVCELPNKFTRVIISFNNRGRLYFNDLRMFGWIRVIEDAKEIGEEKLGPEANNPETFTLEYFKLILSKTKKPIKLLILDQEKLAGVGNIYANEALFRAGIMPARPANEISDDEAKNLRDAIIKVLNEAIKLKGTSDRDEAYRQITGEKGSFQDFLKVYGKAGQDCPGCEGKIKRINLGGRGTFFCEECQR
jgi:formamidopyrimidine-DNA glycosylase